MTPWLLHLLYGLGILVKKTFNFLVDYAIRTKLSSVLCCNRVAYLIRLVENVLFEDSTPLSDVEKSRRKEEAFEHFQNYLRPFIQPMAGTMNYEDGMQFVFDILQDPKMNKQLTYILVDVILEELFPEIVTLKKSLK